MAKGGRYLDKSKSKKMGRGWKITLIVLLVLAILLGGAAIAVSRTYKGFLGKINRAEYGENKLGDDEAAYWATYFPDADTRPQEDGGDTPETAGEEPASGETEAPLQDSELDNGEG